MNRKMSIITNFGCDSGCEYCIWKSHILKNIKNVNIFNILDDILSKYEGPSFSISGGGDPLYKINKNIIWWNKLNSFIVNYNKKISIHSSKPNEFIYLFNTSDIDFNNNFDKLVIHSSIFTYNEMIYKKIKELVNLRLNFVVTNNLNLSFLEKVEDFCIKNNISLSYRELVDNEHLKPTLEVDNYCKSVNLIDKSFRYIKQNDYNYYLMPDGKLYNNFRW